MYKAEILYANGRRESVEPVDHQEEGVAKGTFSLKQMQEIVGGTIDILTVDEGRKYMVVNDDGISLNLPINKEASLIWSEIYPGAIVGDVLLCDRNLIA